MDRHIAKAIARDTPLPEPTAPVLAPMITHMQPDKKPRLPLPPTHTFALYVLGETYIVIPSPPFEPEDQGNTTVFAVFEAVTSLPQFTYETNVSHATILACFDRALLTANRDRMNDTRIHSFMVDPNILDFSDATVRSHASTHCYKLIALLPPARSDASHFPTFLRPLFDKIRSHEDRRAFNYAQAAYASLFDPSYTSPTHGRLALASGALFALASEIFSRHDQPARKNRFPTPTHHKLRP